MIRKILIAAVVIVSLNACTAVKEYQKIYINDPDMALASKKISKFNITYQAYREAASGANGGKTGGGCGCN